MRVEWENTSASRKSFTCPSARRESRPVIAISAGAPDIISAYAVVELTNPAPTIAKRGTLGSFDGDVKIFCKRDSVSRSRIDPIFSSSFTIMNSAKRFLPYDETTGLDIAVSFVSPRAKLDMESYGRNL